jgi:hypothetical protein
MKLTQIDTLQNLISVIHFNQKICLHNLFLALSDFIKGKDIEAEKKIKLEREKKEQEERERIKRKQEIGEVVEDYVRSKTFNDFLERKFSNIFWKQLEKTNYQPRNDWDGGEGRSAGAGRNGGRGRGGGKRWCNVDGRFVD